MGFYKKDNEQILEGENCIFTPNISMTKETKDDFTYPIEGWYWFDTKEEASVFFNIEISK